MIAFRNNMKLSEFTERIMQYDPEDKVVFTDGDGISMNIIGGTLYMFPFYTIQSLINGSDDDEYDYIDIPKLSIADLKEHLEELLEIEKKKKLLNLTKKDREEFHFAVSFLLEFFESIALKEDYSKSK